MSNYGRSELQVSSFEHSQIKQSLIDFLQSEDTFKNWNYEGSALNTIIDLLTRDTHMLSYVANMIANESFIATAQKRANVVSHAQKLSYIPRSKTASRVSGTVTVQAPTMPSSTQLTIPVGVQFIGNDGSGNSYTFTTVDTYTAPMKTNRNGFYFQFKNVELRQGSYITNSFNYTKNSTLVIPNENVDTSTIIVSSESNNSTTYYNYANSIEELGSTENVYFLEENISGKYQIYFGHNILGSEPPTNSVVKISYINTEDNQANGNISVVSASTINGYSNITFIPDGPSYGGSDRESIESIRWLAPKFYESQDRGVTASDYVPILKRQFPFIRDVQAWGGESNNPPKYGTVQLSILSDNMALLTDSIKMQMVNYLNGKNVGSVTPEIVDPYMVNIELNIAFDYDTRQTSLSFNEISDKIRDVVKDYNSNYLYNFNTFYNDSLLERNIMDIEGIITCDITKTVYNTLTYQKNISNPIYDVEFDNAIKPNSVYMDDSSFSISSNGINHKLYDDGNGNIMISYEINDDNGTTVTNKYGSVDYDKGTIEMTVNFITGDSTVFNIYAEPVKDNFYVSQNMVLDITSTTTSELDTSGN